MHAVSDTLGYVLDVLASVFRLLQYVGLVVFALWFAHAGMVSVLAATSPDARGRLLSQSTSKSRPARAVLTRVPSRLGPLAAACVGLSFWFLAVVCAGTVVRVLVS